ncbi:MAG: tRNA (pseudouridine(54)-N(1))-methyltransferase TrmY [Thermoplasmata archaeon]
MTDTPRAVAPPGPKGPSRQFLVLAHRVPVDGAFTLNDLAGGAGRLDEIARAVSTALTLSHDLRRDTEVAILFSSAPPPAARRIRVIGARVRFLNPDERSTAALLKNALIRSAHFPHPFESSPGVVIEAVDPSGALKEFVAEPDTVWLDEAGIPLEDWTPPSIVRAVVSDPSDPTESERSILRAARVPTLSVGPRSLRTSQVIDIFHNRLDRAFGGTGGGSTD